MSRKSEPRSKTRLAAKLALLDEVRQAEIRATSAQVASIIGHMIGTPLNVIVGRAALLRASPTPDSMIDNARRIEEQAQRLTERVQRLIDYLTPPEPSHLKRSAASVIEDALSLYVPIASERNIEVKAPPGHTLQTPVEGTPALMVLSAILSLAIRGVASDKVIELEAEQSSDRNTVIFKVNVPGMQAPEGRVDRLEPPEKYEPMNVERQQELSVCAAIARKNGGRLELVARDEGVSIEFHCATAVSTPRAILA